MVLIECVVFVQCMVLVYRVYGLVWYCYTVMFGQWLWCCYAVGVGTLQCGVSTLCGVTYMSNHHFGYICSV